MEREGYQKTYVLEDGDDAEFLPPIWFELQSEFEDKYRAYCIENGFSTMSDSEDDEVHEEDSGSEPNDRDDEKFYYGEESKSLPKALIYNPPLFNKKDLHHPLCDRDFRNLHFTASGLQSYQFAAMLPSRMRDPSSKLNQLKQGLLSNIHANRKKNPLVRTALKSFITIQARFAGIQSDVAPARVVKVAGSTPLAAFHDRIICPMFGWTRGFHDYRFALPPAMYAPHEPPKFSLLEILFGPESGQTNCMPQYGFYGTLRCTSVLACIPDTKVCVADLLHSQGQDLWHVLGGSGWKTVLSVESIAPIVAEGSNKGAIHPSIISAIGPNVPETLVLSFCNSDFDEYDCGGPQAYLLGCEMLRLSKELPRKAWLKDWLFSMVSSSLGESDFD